MKHLGELPDDRVQRLERATLVPDEWMAPPRAAKYADSSTSTLAKLRLRGGGPRFCRIGRAIRYRRADIDDWLNSTRRRSTSEYR